MSNLVTNIFPEAQLIEHSNIRIGDLLLKEGSTRQPNYGNPAGNGESIRIGRMTLRDDRGCWRDEYNAPFATPSSTQYLIRRQAEALPTNEGAVIQLTEDFDLGGGLVIFAKAVLILNHRGDFANHDYQSISPEQLQGAAFVVFGPISDR